MPFTRATSDLVTRALTGCRMAIETLADGFATPDDDTSVYDDVRRAISSLFDDDAVIQMGVAQVALGAGTPTQLIASAAYSATQNSADQVNTVARGVIAVLNLTAFTTAASVTLGVQRKNADGSYTTIAVAAAPLTAVGKQVVILDPLIGAATAELDNCTSGALPREWRVIATLGNGNSHTFSVGVYAIR